MSTTLEKRAEINPFAPPTTSSSIVQAETLWGDRASLRTIAAVNRLYIVAELAFLGSCVSFFMFSFFPFADAGDLALIAYCVASFVLWCAVAVALFRSGGISFEFMLTLFMLPVPIFGTVMYSHAKQEIRKFMIHNGYLPSFLGFSEDMDERKAMAQDPNYLPSLYFSMNYSRRKRVLSISDCLILIIISAVGFMTLLGLM